MLSSPPNGSGVIEARLTPDQTRLFKRFVSPGQSCYVDPNKLIKPNIN